MLFCTLIKEFSDFSVDTDISTEPMLLAKIGQLVNYIQISFGLATYQHKWQTVAVVLNSMIDNSLFCCLF